MNEEKKVLWPLLIQFPSIIAFIIIMIISYNADGSSGIGSIGNVLLIIDLIISLPAGIIGLVKARKMDILKALTKVICWINIVIAGFYFVLFVFMMVIAFLLNR